MKKVSQTDGQADRQTDRQTEITVLRAAWSQLKILSWAWWLWLPMTSHSPTILISYTRRAVERRLLADGDRQGFSGRCPRVSVRGDNRLQRKGYGDNRACCPVGHYWHYYHSVLSLSQVNTCTWYLRLSDIHIDGLVEERRNSIANALELRLSCSKPSICVVGRRVAG